jgi:hypothetical protein
MDGGRQKANASLVVGSTIAAQIVIRSHDQHQHGEDAREESLQSPLELSPHKGELGTPEYLESRHPVSQHEVTRLLTPLLLTAAPPGGRRSTPFRVERRWSIVWGACWGGIGQSRRSRAGTGDDQRG